MGNFLIRVRPPEDYVGWKVIGVIQIPQSLRHMFPIIDCFTLDHNSWPTTMTVLVLPGVCERVVLIEPKSTNQALWKMILEQVEKEIMETLVTLVTQLLDSMDNNTIN